MGVRVHVGSHEGLKNALRRFRRLIKLNRRCEKRYKAAGQQEPRYYPGLSQVRPYYVKPSQVRTYREYIRRFRATEGEQDREHDRERGFDRWGGVWTAPPPDPPRRWERGS